jgi:hypothetical protein
MLSFFFNVESMKVNMTLRIQISSKFFHICLPALGSTNHSAVSYASGSGQYF